MTVMKTLSFVLVTALVIARFGYELHAIQADDRLGGAVEGTADSLFFAKLLENHVVRVAPDLYIHLPAEDEVFACGSAYPPPEEYQRLISDLYSKKISVLEPIKQWNAAHRLVAIRDNLGDDAAWPSHSDNANRGLSKTRYLSESFGFVLDGVLRPGFSEWTVSGATQRIRLHKTVLLARQTTATIQIIGKQIDSTINPTESKLLCSATSASGECTRQSAQGAVITYQLPAGRHELSFALDPVASAQKHLPGNPIRVAGSYNANAEPQLEFVTFEQAAPASSRFTISTRDGVLLTDHQGVPNDQARALGVLPLIGLHAKSSYALSWLLARSRFKGHVRLTIDSAMQTIVQHQLLSHLNALAAQWDKNNHAQEARFNNKRRAAVVLLNAKSGEILAVAGHPSVPKSVTDWDIAAFAKQYGQYDPLRVSAWHFLDSRYAPGSTFKPVTVLSALRRSNQRLDDYIKGYTVKNFKNRTGMRPDCVAYAPAN